MCEINGGATVLCLCGNKRSQYIQLLKHVEMLSLVQVYTIYIKKSIHLQTKKIFAMRRRILIREQKSSPRMIVEGRIFPHGMDRFSATLETV